MSRSTLVRRYAAALATFTVLPVAAQTLAVQLIDPAGRAGLMNERGDVVGSHYAYPCTVPGTCIPVTEPSAWLAAGGRKVLPGIGALPVAAAAIAADGTVVGSVTDFATASKAIVWRLVNGAYAATDIGNLGLQQASATGVDASGRVVGYAITPFVSTRPFVWTAGGGMLDLAAAGAPPERIFSVSPGGRVLTDRFSFSLDNPAAALPLPAAPAGPPSYQPTYGANFLVNDSGDLAGFHLTVSESFYSLWRWQAASGTWQQLHPVSVKGGSGIPLGVGRINNQSTIGATVGNALMAQGPSGLATLVADRLSPAYPPNALEGTRYFTDQGVILTNIVVGGVARAAKLVPMEACVGACLRVPSITMTGTVVRSPRRGGCGQLKCTKVIASVMVTDASGNSMADTTVGARFMNSYTLDIAATARTNASGVATFTQLGYVGQGTVSMMVETATRTGWAFDRGVGKLTAEVIPR
jgi:hypothetical protein